MNNLFLAPIFAWFHPGFYRSATKSGMGRGFAYLGYLTALFALIFIVICNAMLLPYLKAQGKWFVETAPEMTLTAEGLELNDTNLQQPYEVKHPEMDMPLYVIDTTKDLSGLMEMETTAIFRIGKTHIVGTSEQKSQTRIIELKEGMAAVKQSGRNALIDKPLMDRIIKQILGYVIPLGLVIFIPIFFVWKMIAAFFYSLVALLLNQFRKEKLAYGALWTTSVFAMTPVTMLQWLKWFNPKFPLVLNLLAALFLTTVYLAYGILVVSRNTETTPVSSN